ncbi:CorA family divalent cation transporter [Xanthomonas sp. AmX2]|uniref:magnesium transporter CorA family protein n=1 Tax=Xanthomonas sp. TaxID=29446 RepID=UPI00197DAA61|nr:CorA family divalent cation transporter [Xanthomonas sp.]MBN6150190.1 CorA family divalent cation transporter [Xanthomonas sp.]
MREVDEPRFRLAAKIADARQYPLRLGQVICVASVDAQDRGLDRGSATRSRRRRRPRSPSHRGNSDPFAEETAMADGSESPNAQTRISIALYGREDAAGLQLDDLKRLRLASNELLWVDLQNAQERDIATVWSALNLARDALPARPSKTHPAIGKHDGHFSVRVVAVKDAVGHRYDGAVLTIVAGPDFVVTVHEEAIAFIDELLAREQGTAQIGCLGEASFVASLLDGHLSTYFAACAAFEMEIERLEVQLLADSAPGRACLPQLGRLRRSASRLRRMLAPHRRVFDGLSRPDFLPDDKAPALRHLQELDERFERAMDVVENARDLVVGSFQLFITQTELQTNERMKLLTFVTVVTGMLAVIAGILGMNFDTGLFASNSFGFWAAVALMIVLGLVAVAVGRHRKWI